MNIVNIVKLFGIIILSVGVTFVFDARPIANKRFGFGDQNEGAKTLKIAGFVTSILGGLIAIL